MGLKDCTVGALMAVSDLDRARRFYEDQLGLVPDEQEQEGVIPSHRPEAGSVCNGSRVQDR